VITIKFKCKRNGNKSQMYGMSRISRVQWQVQYTDLRTKDYPGSLSTFQLEGGSNIDPMCMCMFIYSASPVTDNISLEATPPNSIVFLDIILRLYRKIQESTRFWGIVQEELQLERHHMLWTTLYSTICKLI